MNERIKELAEQAELYHLLPNGKLYPRAMSAESCDEAYAKFAQLIVQECVQTCLNNDWEDQQGWGNHYAKKIKKKFGVE